VDYLMVDLARMAGRLRLAEAFGTPVASHLVPEIFAHCIATVPNGL